jgi:hypothetical protein
MSPEHVLTSSAQPHRLEGVRSALDQGKAQCLALTDEESVPENVVLRKNAPAHRFEVVHALRRQFKSLLDGEPSRLAATLRPAGMRMDVKDGLAVGTDL